ncbi:hypothetical protein A2619_02245 [candidate division WWE3 bacterium RIFOXYD1_FULL_39_9]|uniref:N-acetylmuramidase domain-containing protein n=1 Tax=candidate division WWE3 bacterium RIFOXYD1_FULL_39_9 TaxID=1802649 RepID=A0A1F4X3H1_UNCKA|nr:MAG: hypothetical protein A2619_02245 [candidate division WWE3 bacterium RIFOXYD1_FULL_39_9]
MSSKNNTLTLADYKQAAKILKCEVAAIQAVAKVEAPNGGFSEDGLPVILFEGHWFSRLTQHKYDREYPTISYPKWTKKFYGKNQKEEWKRLNAAKLCNPACAYMSASWGKFQILGVNHAYCGFADVYDFVNAMEDSEREHLISFCNYIKNVGLAYELQDRNWNDFAYKYNGPEYKKNGYAEKLYDVYYNRK